ncbi:uncharacterized protein BROUX77_002472 [Berkeleyomyces rouxiae]|uniref:uncharacterized protein n=1 Tax=Berkeleyomyces rouxiae TaxID=2035830 RepID=UPI003B809D6B
MPARSFIFTGTQLLQLLVAVSTIGLASSHISDISGTQCSPPAILTATVIVASTATLYIVVTALLYWKRVLPLALGASGDFVILVAIAVMATVLGNPLSGISCSSLSTPRASMSSYVAPAYIATASTVDNQASSESNVTKALSYSLYASADKTTCSSLKALWALAITMSILFGLSILTQLFLWRRLRITAARFPEAQPSMHSLKSAPDLWSAGYARDLEASSA